MSYEDIYESIKTLEQMLVVNLEWIEQTETKAFYRKKKAIQRLEKQIIDFLRFKKFTSSVCWALVCTLTSGLFISNKGMTKASVYSIV